MNDTSLGVLPESSPREEARDESEAVSSPDAPGAGAALAADDLRCRVEAILTVAETPVEPPALAAALQVSADEAQAALDALRADYDGEGPGPRRGFELRRVGGGWRLYVRRDYDLAVTAFVSGRRRARLSQAALETLAVIAYKQPVTRGQVAAIRAVNVDSVVHTLLAHGLITELFADEETGAINYGTTDLLLTKLGIDSLDQLPKIGPLLDDGAQGFDDELR
ncbi:MAG TPA: SMC-Scp complex subunit ScpB [Microbacteriaceae bacterium]|nr:SMC-Scp complex subunit ScpB [Microbacteriaceae bacterium]